MNLFKEGLLDFIRWHVDILFCNEVEALAITDAEDAQAAFPLLKAMADCQYAQSRAYRRLRTGVHHEAPDSCGCAGVRWLHHQHNN